MKALTWKAEKRSVSDIKALDKNPRKITRAAIEKMKDRIRKRGFHDILKLDHNNIALSGNIRLTALQELEATEVNVLVPSRPLADKERKAVILESNRHDGIWDEGMLPDYGADVLLEVGFESPEIDTLMVSDEDEEDPFNVERALEVAKKPKAKRGDVYMLGDHRVMCGDSTSAEDVDTLMGGLMADMVFCDPPYNMNIEGKQGKILNDHMAAENFVTFSEAFIGQMKRASKPGAPFYICSGYSSYIPFVFALKEHGLEFANPIIWVKNSLGMGMNDYRHQHEMVIKAKNTNKKKRAQPILYGWNAGKHYFREVHDEGDVWQISKHAINTMVHPTQKPLALINRAIKNSSQRGGAVLDLFGGSGATLISAHRTGRRAFIMELDPRYLDVIVKRWEALSGDVAAKLES